MCNAYANIDYVLVQTAVAHSSDDNVCRTNSSMHSQIMYDCVHCVQRLHGMRISIVCSSAVVARCMRHKCIKCAVAFERNREHMFAHSAMSM